MVNAAGPLAQVSIASAGLATLQTARIARGLERICAVELMVAAQAIGQGGLAALAAQS